VFGSMALAPEFVDALGAFRVSGASSK